MRNKYRFHLSGVMGMGFFLFQLSCHSPKGPATVMVYSHPLIASADSALALLVSGNHRFVADSVLTDQLGKEKRTLLKEKGQHPFAIIVTCSDSRVSPEILFDQGLGDLFVIRVAGNVVDSVELGSIEYAVEHLKCPLVMVLGHEKCGAVKATLDGGDLPGALPSIAKRIQPSLLKVKAANGEVTDLAELVGTENAKENAAFITLDPLIHEFMESGKVKVVSAKYHLDTGVVEYFH